MNEEQEESPTSVELLTNGILLGFALYAFGMFHLLEPQLGVGAVVAEVLSLAIAAGISAQTILKILT